MRYALLSQMYSTLSANAQYKEIALHTNDCGKRLLCDILQLPFKEVYADNEHYEGELWIVPFIKTIKSIAPPFLYLHSDTFLQKKLPEYVTNSQVSLLMSRVGKVGWTREMIKQSMLYADSYVFRSMGMTHKCLANEFNLGFLYVNNSEWIEEYCSWSEVLIQKYLSDSTFRHINYYNHYFINSVLHVLWKEHGIEPVVCNELFKHDEFYTDIFQYNPSNVATHIPDHLKRNMTACRELERTVKYAYPEYYERFADFVKTEDAHHWLRISEGNRQSNDVPSVAIDYPLTMETARLIFPDFPEELNTVLTENICDYLESKRFSNHAFFRNILEYERSKALFGKTVRKEDNGVDLSNIEVDNYILLSYNCRLQDNHLLVETGFDWPALLNEDGGMNIGLLLEYLKTAPQKITIIMYYDFVSQQLAEKRLSGFDTILFLLEEEHRLIEIFITMKEMSKVSNNAELRQFTKRFVDTIRFYFRQGIIDLQESNEERALCAMDGDVYAVLGSK